MCAYALLDEIGRIIVKSRIVNVVAASTLLGFGAVGAMAGEPQFRAPDTDRARQTQVVLAEAAQALNAQVPLTVGEHISNLWLFPTAEEEMVFAQYVVSNGRASSQLKGSQQHLELLKVSGNRIVEQLDLTHAVTDSASLAKQTGAGLDRTALIGTGHAMIKTETSATTRGLPASPHWSASIGTGHVSGDSVQPAAASTSAWTLEAPLPDWTSKIGTGHAADSSTSVSGGGVRLTAGE
jgi:hypothetical protein